MKFSTKDFFSKCDQIRQIRNFLRISSHLLKKSLMENFILCVVSVLDMITKRHQDNFAGTLIFNSDQIQHAIRQRRLVFLSMILSKYLPARTEITQLPFPCLKSTMETPEQGVKYT